MAMSGAERARRKREKKIDRGLKKFEIHARPEQEQDLREFERSLDLQWNKTHASSEGI